MNKRNTNFYVSPMSYNNLGLYDYSLLSNINSFDITYFCNALCDERELLEISTEKIYTYSNNSSILKLFSYLKSQLKLLNRCLKELPGIVHFQWLKMPFIDYFVVRLVRKYSGHIILTAHNILPHNSGNFYFMIYKRIYSFVDTIIVHSDKTKLELIDIFKIVPDKIAVIPHGILDMGQKVDDNLIQVEVNKIKAKFNLENKIIFSTLGAINEYKGIDLIVDAWKNDELSHHNEIQLIIAGKGSTEKVSELENINNVHLENRFLSTIEFLAYLRLSDYVLLPYRKISQSGVLLTALNEHKRVIVSDIGGLTDPFVFGNVGFVLKELNAISLRKIILEAVETVQEKPSSEIWEEIERYYNWQHIGNKTNSLYDSIVNQNIN